MDPEQDWGGSNGPGSDVVPQSSPSDQPTEDYSWWRTAGEDPVLERQYTGGRLDSMHDQLANWIAPEWRDEYQRAYTMPLPPILEYGASGYFVVPGEDPFMADPLRQPDYGYGTAAYAPWAGYDTMWHETAHQMDNARQGALAQEFGQYYGSLPMEAQAATRQQLTDYYRGTGYPFDPAEFWRRAADPVWGYTEPYAYFSELGQRMPEDMKRFYPWVNWGAGDIPRGSYENPNVPTPSYWRPPTTVPPAWVGQPASAGGYE